MRIDKDKYERGEKPQEAERFFNLKGIKKSHTKKQREDERSQERREEANSSNKFEEDSRR